MATQRRFCRFARAKEEYVGNPVYTTDIPQGGMCLSSFLVITEGDSDRVLMGHLNPGAAWDEIGALDAERAEVHSKRWMLPSSHLMLYESPQDAARRILREQLGMEGLDLTGPSVIAEAGTPKRFPNLPKHWDFEFIFRGRMAEGEAPKNEAWSDLSFIDLHRTGRDGIARSHDEVLENAGLRF